MELEKAQKHFDATGPILQAMITENLTSPRIVDQIHQLVNHLLVVRAYLHKDDN